MKTFSYYKSMTISIYLYEIIRRQGGKCWPRQQDKGKRSSARKSKHSKVQKKGIRVIMHRPLSYPSKPILIANDQTILWGRNDSLYTPNPSSPVYLRSLQNQGDNSGLAHATRNLSKLGGWLRGMQYETSRWVEHQLWRGVWDNSPREIFFFQWIHSSEQSYQIHE